MSKKSKKGKKKIPLPPLSASKIDYLTTNKYDVEDDGFWSWFFEDIETGATSFLCLNEKEPIPEKFQNYLSILRDEFLKEVDDDDCLEIENDL